MATLRYQLPGIGGSLGSCAVCGEPFLMEIMLGKNVDMIGVAGLDRNVPVHRACGEEVIAHQGKWEDVRETFPRGPLYDCFEEEYVNAQAQTTEAPAK